MGYRFKVLLSACGEDVEPYCGQAKNNDEYKADVEAGNKETVCANRVFRGVCGRYCGVATDCNSYKYEKNTSKCL